MSNRSLFPFPLVTRRRWYGSTVCQTPFEPLGLCCNRTSTTLQILGIHDSYVVGGGGEVSDPRSEPCASGSKSSDESGGELLELGDTLTKVR